MSRSLHLSTIYFHTDYDGVVSAAMLLRLARTAPQLKGVDYDIKPEWASLHLDRNAAVVDFLFHPGAHVWFDHHGTPFVLPSWRATFRPDARHVWDPSSPACPPVIARSLAFSLDERRHFADYIHWSEVIDGARYRSPLEAHDLSNPHFVLSRALALIDEAATLEDVVHAVARQPADAVLSCPRVLPFASSAHEMESRLRRRLEHHIAFDGRVALLDQSEEPGPYQRYLPYLFYPDARFVVGIYRKGNAWNVSVGANPWKDLPMVNVGHLCQKWGGGGHPSVGGVTVNRHDEAVRIASAIRDEIEAVQ